MKRTIPLILALLMASQCFLTACGNTEAEIETETTPQQTFSENSGSADSSETIEETEPETEPSLYDTLQPKDYEGYTFRFFTEGSNYGITAMDAEEVNGEIINDTIYERNRYIEDQLNIVFSDTWADWMEPRDRLKIMVPAGSDDFDVMWYGVYLNSSLSSEHMINLYEIEDINWDDPWWEKDIRDIYEIKGKLFFTHTPMNLHYYESLVTPLFNKTIAEQNQLDNLYDIVNEGKWTFDKMAEIAVSMIKDIDGNGKMERSKDLFGIAASTNLVAYMMVSGGCQVIGADETGYPQFLGLSERFTSVVESMAKTFSVPDILIENGDYIQQFQNQHSLFFLDTLGRVKDFRSLDADFGILPLPKYDEAQEDYISSIFNGALAMVVPSTCREGHNIGTILNYLSALSYRDLIPAYYEKNIQGKQMRDEDSVKMLEIMLSNIRADLSLIFEWCGMNNLILTSSKTNGTNLASKFKAMEKAMVVTIDRMYQGYTK